MQSFVRENHIALEGSGEGRLAGTVFAAKDVFRILGSTWGNGHPDWLRYSEPDSFTSQTILKLLDEGADLVGKTICDELCFSISGENWNYGSPLNPHDPRRFAGGSSSGSGAAAGGGLVDFSLGSDCLGSVRVPASYNGVFGMRPTYQRVNNDGEAPYCESMDVLGYMAKESDMFVNVSSVLLGQDQKEHKFKKLLLPKECFDIIDKDLKLQLEDTIKEIEAEFDEVISCDITPNGLDEWVKIFQLVQGYEVWESYGGFIRKYRPRLSRGPKERLAWAATISRQEYDKALKDKEEIEAHIDQLLDNDTVMLMPTSASVAPLRSAPLAEINRVRAQSSGLLCVSPLSGIPQVTMPIMEIDEVPFGLSLLGKQGSDLALVNLAASLYHKVK